MQKPLVGIVMGSDSDLSIMQETSKILDEFGVPYEITVISAHRAPEKNIQLCQKCERKGV
jgi:5-(carboxyamino)imidazole ribonucleotide mutase